MFQLENCVAFLTCRGAKTLASILEKRLQSHKVTRVQWIAMHYISRDEQMTQKHLSEMMAIKEPTIAQLLHRMEAEDLIAKVPMEGDKRVNILKLTSKGNRLNDEITPIAEQFKEDATKDLTQEQLDTFELVLHKMITNTQDER